MRAAKSSRSASSVALTVFTNILLSRPIRFGIEIQKPLLEGRQPTGIGTVVYRISRRQGALGFSLTAGEEKSGSSSSRSTGGMSPRLSPWLLQPAVVPLNPLSIQHLLPNNQRIVALNVGGLHYFGFRPLLSSLADTIMEAGVNVASDPTVSSFFTSYGYKEGCAMCLLLAIGCGPSGMSSVSSELKSRACRAALARAFCPKLVPVETAAATPTVPNDTFMMVPQGYEYKPSALCESVAIVLARLLRPVWYKPAVVVTEGRVIKRVGFSAVKTTPAKVELLLDDATLESIRQPLYAFQCLMKDIFARAINVVPGASAQGRSKGDAMDVDENTVPDDQEHFLTRALEYQIHARAGSGAGGVRQLRPSDAEEIARLMEERIIHSYYRLLSRTVQLLSLLSHLRRAHHMAELPEVEWGLLHGISFAQLVQARDGQERLESLLNSLITSTSSEAKSVTPSADEKQLANLFAEQCYHYFSPGARFSYLGFRSANEALAMPPNTSRRGVRVTEAVRYLKQAARYWYSAPLITGRILHTREKESYDEIANRATRFDSPLAKAVELLIQLGEVAAALDICLLSASNFTGKKISV